jgi:hypothetical protein
MKRNRKSKKVRNNQSQKRIIKKRYILASFSVVIHIIGALWVLYKIIFDIDEWLETMNLTRIFLGYEHHEHRQSVIFKIWITAIQIRYILTDFWAFFNAISNHLLLEFTIKMHMMEGVICSIVFFLHNSDDCFVFGIICCFWTIMWFIAFLFIVFGEKQRHVIDQ